MAILNESDIPDLIASTRTDVALEGYMVDIASNLTDYSYKKLFSEEKLETQSGDVIKGNLLVRHNNSAQMVGLHQVIEINITDVLNKFQIPWRHTTYHWAWERRIPLMNKGRNQIVNMIKAQRAGAKIAAAELLEPQLWGKPADSTNEEDVFGVKYWMKYGTSTTPGFNGGNPTGFSAGAGGLDSTTYTKWANYNGVYVAAIDLLRMMRKGYRATRFVSPVNEAQYLKGKGADQKIHCNEETCDLLEEQLASRNDNHTDLAQFMGATSFKKKALEYVPHLDADTQNPLFFLDWGTLAVVVLEGDNDFEHPAMRSVNQPNTWVVHNDLTWNLLCMNRRRNAVFNKAA